MLFLFCCFEHPVQVCMISLIILGRWQHASSSSLSRRVSMSSLPPHSTAGSRQKGRKRCPNSWQTSCHCLVLFTPFLIFSFFASPPPQLFFSTGVGPVGCRDTLCSPHLCLPHRPHHSLLWLCLFSPCSPPLRRTAALRWWGAYPPAVVLYLRALPGFEWSH